MGWTGMINKRYVVSIVRCIVTIFYHGILKLEVNNKLKKILLNKYSTFLGKHLYLIKKVLSSHQNIDYNIL